MTEDEVVGWHHRRDGHEFELALGVGDGQGSLVCFSPWYCKESDTTERLNWIELNIHWTSSVMLLVKICLQCRSCKRHGFGPWVRKIPWKRTWQPSPVFLFGESHGQMILAGYSPWQCWVRHNWRKLAQHTAIHWYISEFYSKDLEATGVTSKVRNMLEDQETCNNGVSDWNTWTKLGMLFLCSLRKYM